MDPAPDINRLIAIMAALRTPGTGCAWDLAQSFGTIAPYTVEEAYEVADAVERGDMEDLRDELGDLLLQVVFHARMAEELRAFDFGDVVEAICRKLIRRHPHVFGTARNLSPDAVKALWDEIKQDEKRERTERRRASGAAVEQSHLSGVPVALPALSRAVKLTARAAQVGFDWSQTAPVIEKIREEIAEVEEALSGKADAAALHDEVGDVLFAVANLARHLGVDPEGALRGTNAKFVRRFGAIEAGLAARGRSLQDANLDEMEALWVEAKADERRRTADQDAAGSRSASG